MYLEERLISVEIFTPLFLYVLYIFKGESSRVESSAAAQL